MENSCACMMYIPKLALVTVNFPIHAHGEHPNATGRGPLSWKEKRYIRNALRLCMTLNLPCQDRGEPGARLILDTRTFDSCFAKTLDLEKFFLNIRIV